MHKISVVGNTKLTVRCLEKHLLPHFKVCSIFSLPPDKTYQKVNGVDLAPLCKENSIQFYNDDDWERFHQENIKQGVNILFVLGDSRIIPKNLIQHYKYIFGNHGAQLPNIKGGASLVWGKILNSGNWGVSIFKITEGIDTGPLISSKQFTYPTDSTMEEFVNIADGYTVELIGSLCEKLNNLEDILCYPNAPAQVKISKHVDSQVAIDIMEICRVSDIPLYLPSRTPADSRIQTNWEDNFLQKFKMANDYPYPLWTIK